MSVKKYIKQYLTEASVKLPAIKNWELEQSKFVSSYKRFTEKDGYIIRLDLDDKSYTAIHYPKSPDGTFNLNHGKKIMSGLYKKEIDLIKITKEVEKKAKI